MADPRDEDIKELATVCYALAAHIQQILPRAWAADPVERDLDDLKERAHRLVDKVSARMAT